MSVPAVYAAINAVAADLALTGIAKSRVNHVDDYKYRSIDDVLDRLAPLLPKHRLCVLPRVVEREVTERADEMQRLLLNVVLRVAFTLTSVDDGSSHIVEVYGEALDGGDKATAKAMSAAYKSAVVQTFCIPVSGSEDPDRTGHRLTARIHEPEPVQGWQQWCADIEDIIRVCESEQAIATVQESNRPPLDLRVNTLKADREKVARQLSRFAVVPTSYSPVGLRAPPVDGSRRHPNVQTDEAFQRGRFEVQDEGSQIAALLSGAKPGEQVLDLCAGAGGKTLALAARMANRGQIYAHDSDRNRLAPIFDRLKRAGARNVQVRPPGRTPSTDSKGRWTACSSTRPAPAPASGAATPTPSGG